MMHIFDSMFEEQRLEEEKRKKAYRKKHEEMLLELGITEEEWQLREKRRKEEEAKRKKENRKNNILAAIVIAAIFAILILIAVLTHNTIISGILGFVVGFLILVYLPFLLGYIVEFIMRRKIEFSNWAFFGSIIFSGFLGIVVGSNLYSACIYEYGDDKIVYITPEGYCYHESRSCFELTGHKTIGVRFGSIKNNKRACEICCH